MPYVPLEAVIPNEHRLLRLIFIIPQVTKRWPVSVAAWCVEKRLSELILTLYDRLVMLLVSLLLLIF